ncbi:MAG: twin-arginine translocase TatA/TatE family subunit [Syntrophobacteraceae bacterium]
MFSIPDMAVILAVVLILFGPGKLPDIGASLGKGIRNFKKAAEEAEKTVAEEVQKIEQLEHKPAAAVEELPGERVSKPQA